MSEFEWKFQVLHLVEVAVARVGKVVYEIGTTVGR